MGAGEDSSQGRGCRRGCMVWEGGMTRRKGVQRFWWWSRVGNWVGEKGGRGWEALI